MALGSALPSGVSKQYGKRTSRPSEVTDSMASPRSLKGTEDLTFHIKYWMGESWAWR